MRVSLAQPYNYCNRFYFQLVYYAYIYWHMLATRKHNSVLSRIAHDELPNRLSSVSVHFTTVWHLPIHRTHSHQTHSTLSGRIHVHHCSVRGHPVVRRRPFYSSHFVQSQRAASHSSAGQSVARHCLCRLSLCPHRHLFVATQIARTLFKRNRSVGSSYRCRHSGTAAVAAAATILSNYYYRKCPI